VASNDITDYLITTLTKQGYTVFDRRSLDEIFKQQGLESVVAFDQKTLEAIGKIEGVDAVLYGNIKSYSELWGKSELSLHLQCTYIGKGVTPWAYDIVSDNTTEGRRMMPYYIGFGIIVFFAIIFFGLRRSGKSKVLNR